jgi:ribose 5-phosphate isomerase A
MNPKQRAADAALEMIENDMVVGLGTGSTAELFIASLGQALREGRIRGIRGIPTSNKSHLQASDLRIPIVSLSQCPRIDVDVDGADEIDPNLNLIKGLGGALLREKIIAQASVRMVVIADSTKRVAVLGSKSPLPVEVVTFEHESQARFLQTLGCEPVLRQTTGGEPFITDNGNVIYDCRFPRIEDPAGLEHKLAARAGIVESGLFLGLATIALIAGADGVERLTRSS